MNFPKKALQLYDVWGREQTKFPKRAPTVYLCTECKGTRIIPKILHIYICMSKQWTRKENNSENKTYIKTNTVWSLYLINITDIQQRLSYLTFKVQFQLGI